MASICGVSIKGLKKFLDHESLPCYQGDLYIGRKKIASWSQDYMGGICDTLRMEDGCSEKKLREALEKGWKNIKVITPSEKQYGKNLPFAIEFVLSDLVILMDQEKRYKAAAKAGYIGILETTNGRTIYTWNVPGTCTGKDVLEEYKDELLEVYEKEFKSTPYITDYFTADSFDLGVPIQLKDIQE